MENYKRKLLISGVFCLMSVTLPAQIWKEGIIKEEFIFEKTSFPESHAATIAETPDGLVAAWFGGTKERNPDVGIWISFFKNDQWTPPVEVANGIENDTLRYACWNPVLYQVPNGDLLLFYKVGPNVAGWKGYMTASKDHGKSWSKPNSLPEGFIGPVKNKPILMPNGELWCPSSTEGNGWKVHFEVTADHGKTWSAADGRRHRRRKNHHTGGDDGPPQCHLHKPHLDN